MGKLTITLKWNESKNQWDMEREDNGLFINEFYNCENLHGFFTDLDKSMVYCFEMTSRLLWQSQK